MQSKNVKNKGQVQGCSKAKKVLWCTWEVVHTCKRMECINVLYSVTQGRVLHKGHMIIAAGETPKSELKIKIKIKTITLKYLYKKTTIII